MNESSASESAVTAETPTTGPSPSELVPETAAPEAPIEPTVADVPAVQYNGLTIPPEFDPASYYAGYAAGKGW